METSSSLAGPRASALLAGWDPLSLSLLFESIPFATFVGSVPPEVHTFSHLAIVHPDDVERVTRFFAELASLREPSEISYRVRSGPECWRAIVFSAMPRGSEILASLHFAVPEDSAAASSDDLRSFRELADAMPQLVWQADATGMVKYYNRKVETYSGATRNPLTGEWRWSQIVHPDDLDGTLAAWQHSVQTGEIYEFEHRVRMADGAFRWHLSRGIPIRDAGGHIVKWFGTATDIHTTRLAAEALRLGETRLRIALSAAALGVFEIDLDAGLVYPVNARFNEILSHNAPTGPMLIEELRARFHREDVDTCEHCLSKARQTGSLSLECRIHGPDGSERWVKIDGTMTDGGSRATCVIADVTVQRMATESLLLAKERIEATLTVSEIGVWFFDIPHNRVLGDANLLKLFGIDARPGTALPIERYYACIHRDDMERVRDIVSKAVQEEDFIDCEYRVAWPDGSVHWIHARGRIERDAAGKAVALPGVATDITARRLAEEELRRSELRLRVAQKAANIGTWESTFAEGVPGSTYWSPEMWRIYGFEPDSVDPFQAFHAALHPEDREHILSRYQELLRSHDETLRYEFRIIRPDGSVRWIESIGRIVRDRDGRPSIVTGINLDTTPAKEFQEELRRRAEEVEQIMNVAPVAIWVSQDPDCGVIRGNRKANEFSEVLQTENVAEKHEGPHRFFRPDGTPIAPEDLPMQVAARSNSEILNTEIVVRLPSGDLRTMLGSAVPLRDADGNVRGSLAAFVDITERKRTEEALRESEQRFRTMADGLPAVVWVHDAEGRQLFVNRTLREFFGIGDREPGVDDWKQWLHPEDAEAYVSEFQTCMKERRPYYAVARAKRHNGEWRWLESHGQPRFSDGGEFLGMVGASFDVTDRKNAEDRLRQQEAELRSLADNTPDPLARFDRECRHLFVSKAAELATGLPKEAFIGKTNRELGMPDHLCDLWEAAIARAFETGEIQRTAFAFETPLGWRHFDCTLIPEASTHPGSGDHVLTVARDITDLTVIMDELRQAKDAAESASRARDKFLAVLSHELRTPLSPILMTASVYARDTSLPPPLRDAMEMIRRNVKVEARLIDDLLDLSRVLNGKLHLESHLLAIHRVALHAIETCGEEIQAKRIDLQVSLRAACDAVMGDSARLQQVLWNLVKNAVKFTDEGGTIEISSWNEEGSISVSVRDSGCGIPPDSLARIFQAFEQAGDRANQRSGGLGLGLAISKGIVDLHRGSLAAQSEGAGRGAEFILRLPLASHAAARADANRPQTPKSSALQPRLLLIEDHPDTAMAVSALLRSRGFDVLVAEDGRSALEAVQAHTLDAIVSDIGLPDINGNDLFPKIREIRPLPGIAVSGYGTEEDIRRSHEAGFAEHLVKPIDGEKLEQALRRILARNPASPLQRSEVHCS